MEQIRVFLAGRYVIIREGLKMLIDTQPDIQVVGEASDNRDAWRKAKETRADVVVLIDRFIPGRAGVPTVAQATASLKRVFPEVKVLVLTAHEDVEYLHQLLKAGASGYVLKRAAAEELTRAIRTVTTGMIHPNSTLSGQVLDGYDYQPRAESIRSESEEDEPQAALSEREREVLILIARGFTNKEIAARLHISVKTVETYKTRLMEKLELKSRSDIVSYALRQGWL